MARARLAIATAILAALTVAASAQDYPSYESRGYGGPLYVGPNFHSNDSSSSERPAPRHVAPVRKKSSTAKAAPANDDSDKSKDPDKSKDRAANENSGIARNSLAKADSDAADKTDASKGAQSENSTITRASLDKDAGKKSTAANATASTGEPKTTQSVGCKKYFPTAGMTLSVPCE